QPEHVIPDESLMSTESISRIELADYGIGTTHSGEYLPVSSGQRNAARFRKTLLDAGSGQSRSASAAQSALTITGLDWRPDHVTATVDASSPDRLLLHQFAFPGWTAELEGRPASLAAGGPLGLLALDVPAGRHTVE